MQSSEAISISQMSGIKPSIFYIPHMCLMASNHDVLNDNSFLMLYKCRNNVLALWSLTWHIINYIMYNNNYTVYVVIPSSPTHVAFPTNISAVSVPELHSFSNCFPSINIASSGERIPSEVQLRKILFLLSGQLWALA